MPPDRRATVADDLISRVSAADLGHGPWGEVGSPTVVGRTRSMHHDRAGKVLTGEIEDQAAEAVALLVERGALDLETAPLRTHRDCPQRPSRRQPRPMHSATAVIAVIVEPDRPRRWGPNCSERPRCSATPSGRGSMRWPSKPSRRSHRPGPGRRRRGHSIRRIRCGRGRGSRRDDLVSRSAALGGAGPEHRLRARGPRADRRPRPGRRDWWEMPSGSRLPMVTWSQPSRRSRERWWRTSPAPRPSVWCRCAPGSCPLPARRTYLVAGVDLGDGPAGSGPRAVAAAGR